MGEPKLREAPGVVVDESLEPELLDESRQLARRGGSFIEVDKMRFHSSLSKKTQGRPRVGAFPSPEDLNFHRPRSAVIDRGQPSPETAFRVISPKKRVYLPPRVVGTGPTRSDSLGQIFSPATAVADADGTMGHPGR